MRDEDVDSLRDVLPELVAFSLFVLEGHAAEVGGVGRAEYLDAVDVG